MRSTSTILSAHVTPPRRQRRGGSVSRASSTPVTSAHPRRKFQAEFGFDFSAQFDGGRKAARLLALACAEHAR